MLVIIIAVLIGISLAKLEPNQMGLDYSGISYSINYKKDDNGNVGTQPWNEGGLFFLGPGHKFIKFSKAVQKIDMQNAGESIMARTKDGLEVNIQCRVNYLLKQDQFRLASLYLMFEEDFDSAFRSVARGVVRDVAGEFDAFEFWTKRDQISDAIQADLEIRFDDMHATVSNFLLAGFELPAAFKNEITRTDEQKQEYESRLLTQQREEQDIQARTLQAEQAIRVIEQEAETKAVEINNTYSADAFRIQSLTDAETTAYKSLKDRLQLSSQQVVNLVWLDTLKGLGSSTKVNFYMDIPKSLAL